MKETVKLTLQRNPLERIMKKESLKSLAETVRFLTGFYNNTKR